MMYFECRLCGKSQPRSGFHRDKRAKNGIKIGRCKSCYAVAEGNRISVPLTSAESKLLHQWLCGPSSGLDTTHKWGHDPITPRVGVNGGSND